MVATTLNGVLLTGDHASRPAASAVAKGTLYSCTTHALLYQSDASSWTTWANLAGTGSVATDTLWDAKGDLAVGTGANTAAKLTVGANDTIPMADSGETTGIKWVASATPSTQALGDSAAVGTADTFTRGDHKHAMPAAAVTTSGLTQATARLLGRTTASTGAIEEITVGTGLSLSAGSLTASGGSGLAHSQVGTTSAGGSFESPASGITYLKKITLASASLVSAIVVHVKGNNANAAGLGVHIYSDSAGAPVNVIASGRPVGSDGAGTATNNIQLNTTARWVGMPIGQWLAAADYWLAVMLSPNGNTGAIQIAYAGSGADKTQAHGLRDLDISIVGTSNTSNDYSIYADILS